MADKAGVFFALLLAATAAGANSLPSWYSCSCAAGTSGCVCPSTSPPGGLDPKDTPQFILFTHDDAITSETNKAFRTVLDGKKSANGCKAVATMFTTFPETDCSLLRKMYNDGYEIADHTMKHMMMNGFTTDQVVAEVVVARARIASACGIPEADIVGFRQPYLQSSSTVRQVLYDNGFLYDSTMIEEPTHSLSGGMSARVWPYSLGNGVPQNCDWYAPEQTCSKQERYPGMFEVPVWALNAAGMFSMDYGDWSGDGVSRSAFDILKANFDAAYAGNRAPLPVYVHTPWFYRKGHLEDMQKFTDYVLAKPNVYFITMRQLLDWMQNPIPASKLTAAALGCGQPGGAGPNGTGDTGTRSISPSPSPPPALSPSPPPAPLPQPAPSPPPAPAVIPTASPSPRPSPSPLAVESPPVAASPVPAPAPAPLVAPSDASPTQQPPAPAASEVDVQEAAAPAPSPGVATPPSSAAASAAKTVVAGAVGCLALLLLL